MTIDSLYVPVGRRKTCELIVGLGHIGRAVDADAVVVPEHSQLVEAEVTCQRNCLVADAFHQAAVTRDDPGTMIDEFVSVARIE